MTISPSYFACIAPRIDSAGGALKKSETTLENQMEGDESSSNGESFSLSSIADSEILRCNILNARWLEVGKKLWGSIEGLGVVSNRDCAENERILEEMENRDKEGMVVLKGILKLTP